MITVFRRGASAAVLPSRNHAKLQSQNRHFSVIRTVGREVSILGGIFGTAFGSVCLAGIMAERNFEAKEDEAPPVVGLRVPLRDGRRLHVRETRCRYSSQRTYQGQDHAGSQEPAMVLPLREQYDDAVAYLGSLKQIPSNDQRLKAYGLFKQASLGDCETSGRPGMFDPVGRAKWDAWRKVAGASQEEAMLLYVAHARQTRSDFNGDAKAKGAAAAANGTGGSSKEDPAQVPRSLLTVEEIGHEAREAVPLCDEEKVLTVLFEAGQGETVLEWGHVLEKVAQQLLEGRNKESSSPNGGKTDVAPLGVDVVRLVAYSRSGLGLSDAAPRPAAALPFPLSEMFASAPPPLPPSPPPPSLSSSPSVPVSPPLSSSLSSSVRSSVVIASEARELLAALGVTKGPLIVVAHGTGCFHARALCDLLARRSTRSTQPPPLRVCGLVLVEPVVEGVASDHCKLSPEVAHALETQRLKQALQSSVFARCGFLRVGSSWSRTQKRQADLLYGPPSELGSAALSWSNRGPHKETEFRELQQWSTNETDMAAMDMSPPSTANLASPPPSPPSPPPTGFHATDGGGSGHEGQQDLNPYPVVVLTRGRRGALFGQAANSSLDDNGGGERGGEGTVSLLEALEAAWDEGQTRLVNSFRGKNAVAGSAARSGGGGGDNERREVVLAAIEQSGTRLPIFFPSAIAAAVDAVIETAAAPASLFSSPLVTWPTGDTAAGHLVCLKDRLRDSNCVTHDDAEENPDGIQFRFIS